MPTKRYNAVEERKKTFRSLVIAAGLLLLILAAALVLRAETARSRQAVITAMNLERSLSSLLSAIQDAETGQRGFLITNDETYLSPYLTSLKSTPEALLQIGEYIEPGPERAAYERLSRLTKAKYEELAATIGTKRQGDERATINRMKTDEGIHLMDSIRAEIASLKDSETVELDKNMSRVLNIFKLDLALRVIVFFGLAIILYFLYSRLRPTIRRLESTLTEMETEIATREETERTNKILISTLRNKNEDLDHFAHLASHDLQEPLRTIDNFVGIIEEEQADAIGPEGEVYFSFIHDATARMRTLIKTFLRYSQLGHGEELTTVNLNQVITDVRKNLHATIQETGAVFHVVKLPVIEGYPVELTQLFQNLIGNALKFVVEGEKPVVEIFLEEGTSSHKIGIRDNGIGMNAAAIAKIFHMFSRVNEAGAYEGHGIGLAFCRKIAELHHGELTVESAPGSGSTFYLTLPFQQNQNEKETETHSADR